MSRYTLPNGETFTSNARDRRLLVRATRPDSWRTAVLNDTQAAYLESRGLFDAMDWYLTPLGVRVYRAEGLGQ